MVSSKNPLSNKLDAARPLLYRQIADDDAAISLQGSLHKANGIAEHAAVILAASGWNSLLI